MKAYIAPELREVLDDPERALEYTDRLVEYVQKNVFHKNRTPRTLSSVQSVEESETDEGSATAS